MVGFHPVLDIVILFCAISRHDTECLSLVFSKAVLVIIDSQDKALVRSTEVIKMLENEAESLFKNKCESKNFNVIHSEPFGVHVELLGPPMEGKPQVTVVGSALLLSGKRGGLKTLLRCSIPVQNYDAVAAKGIITREGQLHIWLPLLEEQEKNLKNFSFEIDVKESF
ncbi:hypothetical protein L1987_39409 [Smallanthus sonchifolius]|uniref:Uncharacterized protein n=2 Tax=Smallanthus sonchifolius TaxID=185202 RepID=A0ACB9HM88_9ASTR|nr:hypothetical protein L1987_39406 [Smallanthus sonchifolius]KAI3796729.1 hypothetical protein L1987_39409 [Smallanthus sonchifolius]